MIFASNVFLFLYLPVFLLVYFLARPAWRSSVIVAASYLFYAWWRPDFLLLFVGDLRTPRKNLGTVLKALGVPAGSLLGNGLTANVAIGDDFSILLQALGTSTITADRG